MCKVSFLVTYYNQAEYVHDSLSSIFALDLPCDFEIIIGNDGSTDTTLDEIKKEAACIKEKVEIYTADRSDGVTDGVVRASNLRRTLLEKSTGDYFCILDGDDYYVDREFIKEAIKTFETHVDISIVMYNYQIKYNNRTEKRLSGMKEGIILPVDYIKHYYSPAGACVYKRYVDKDFLRRLNTAVYYDDNDIPILNLIRGEIYYYDKCIMNYRQVNNSEWNGLLRSEQGMLNVLGADNEVQLVPEYSKEIYYRYRSDILYTYFRKDFLELYIRKQLLDNYKTIIRDDWILSSALISKMNRENENKKLYQIIGYLKKADREEYDRIYSNVKKESMFDC